MQQQGTNQKTNNSQNYYFAVIDENKIKSKNELTRLILQNWEGLSDFSLDEEMLTKLFSAIDAEIERLNNNSASSKVEEFVNKITDVINSIHNFYMQTEQLSNKQLIYLFNILYGLSKCY